MPLETCIKLFIALSLAFCSYSYEMYSVQTNYYLRFNWYVRIYYKKLCGVAFFVAFLNNFNDMLWWWWTITVNSSSLRIYLTFDYNESFIALLSHSVHTTKQFIQLDTSTRIFQYLKLLRYLYLIFFAKWWWLECREITERKKEFVRIFCLP